MHLLAFHAYITPLLMNFSVFCDIFHQLKTFRQNTLILAKKKRLIFLADQAAFHLENGNP
jgi:hypothetical protein